MRNPFKKVFCDDCEHCILATNFNDIELQLLYSKCKVDPKITRKYVSKTPEDKDYYYCQNRFLPFCFKFKDKK